MLRQLPAKQPVPQYLLGYPYRLNQRGAPEFICSEPILGFELAQVRLEMFSHRIGIDARDIAVVLVIDNLAAIALACQLIQVQPITTRSGFHRAASAGRVC